MTTTTGEDRDEDGDDDGAAAATASTATHGGHRIVRIVFVLFVSAAAPVLVRILLGDEHSAKAFTGMLAGLLLTATTRDPRIGVAGVAALTASVFVALVAASSPAVGAAWTVLLAVGVGVAARVGIAGTWFVVTVPAAYMLIAPFGVDAASKISVQQVASVSAGTAAGYAAVTALCGLWAVVINTLVPLLSTATPRSPLPARAAAVLALIVAVATVPVMWFVLSDDRIPLAGWWLLTVYIVTVPQPGDLRAGGKRRTVHRVAGTVAGVIVAAVLSSVLRSTTLQHLAGAVFLVTAFTQFGDPARYWRFVALLTPGIVLLDSTAATVREAAELRLEFTLLGVATAVVGVVAVMLIAQGTRALLRRDAGTAGDASATA